MLKRARRVTLVELTIREMETRAVNLRDFISGCRPTQSEHKRDCKGELPAVEWFLGELYQLLPRARELDAAGEEVE